MQPPEGASRRRTDARDGASEKVDFLRD
jgi:hypothetical protein